ncbi:hypothetical protein [Amycolatopsis thermoflava]|uniref:hypothetical protein n=2 Tax=Amycolatopsis thermoflava TaxID=84480 RepID=UPI003D738053
MTLQQLFGAPPQRPRGPDGASLLGWVVDQSPFPGPFPWAASYRDEAVARIDATAGPGQIAAEMVALGLISRATAEEYLGNGPGETVPARLVRDLFEAEGVLVEFEPKSYTVPPAYGDLANRFATVAGTSCENLELSDDFELSFVHNGQRHEFTPDDQGKYFDLLTVDEIAGALSPPGPRRFVPLGEEAYVLVDPRALDQLVKTFAIEA